MKRFDVRASGRSVGAGKDRLVVVLQHEALEVLDTVIVAPLFKPSDLPPVTNLRPLVTVGRQRMVVAVDRMVSLPKRDLGKTVGSLQSASFELVRSIDLLFSGF